MGVMYRKPKLHFVSWKTNKHETEAMYRYCAERVKEKLKKGTALMKVE